MNKVLRKVGVVAVVLTGLIATANAQEKTATVFGSKINYIEAGDRSKPTVIFLHGLGSNLTAWQFNVPAVSPNYHVIAVDQIGFGKSDKPMLKYRVGTYVDFLDRFMTEIKVDKATLVGNSMGGWIAALTAIKYPSRVEKLVLVDAAGLRPTSIDMAQIYSLNYSTRDEVKALIPLVFANSAPLLAPAQIDLAMTARLSAGDGYTISSLIESIRRGEDFLNGKLGAIKKPTFIVWGKQDGLIKPSDATAYHRGIAGSELLLMDGAGHAPQIEKALDFNKALTAFLAK